MIRNFRVQKTVDYKSLTLESIRKFLRPILIKKCKRLKRFRAAVHNLTSENHWKSVGPHLAPSALTLFLFLCLGGCLRGVIRREDFLFSDESLQGADRCSGPPLPENLYKSTQLF